MVVFDVANFHFVTFAFSIYILFCNLVDLVFIAVQLNPPLSVTEAFFFPGW